MGASAGGCCVSCSTAQSKETLPLMQSGIDSREAKKEKSAPSAAPRSPQPSSTSSPRGPPGNSGGTGETPDEHDEAIASTGTSGVGLANKNNKMDKAARKSRSSIFSLQAMDRVDEEEEESSALAEPVIHQSSLKERVGRKSFLDFSHPQQTIIIFDWDDTLFPTTWIQEDMELNVCLPCPKSKEVVGPLKRCATRAAELVKLAASMAEQVSIVTLAESPWVDYTVKKFYQSMEKVLANLNIRIIYARDAAAQADGGGTKEKGAYDKQNFQSSEERAAYWTGVKGTAIRIECERFYSQYDQQTWKNVISFGDSDFEKEGTIEVTRQYVLSKKQQGAYQLPRTKTVKFLDSPSAEELCNEMRLVKQWLPTLIRKDEGFNLDFENIGPGNIEDINALLNEARLHEAEPRSEALFDNLFWKKDKNGDPFNESHWRPRRIWLSKTGRMWYESLKDVKAMELFDGACVGDLEVVKLISGKDIVSSIEGLPVFGLSFKKAAGNADFFVLSQDEDREELLTQINSFRKGGK
mmetsp:Transcript_129209/g.234738  ORF Transcript_129209/g.234738 Transcript_129209/m.234738 type:complete len:524 (-) Transcript_129209:215-1786(-)